MKWSDYPISKVIIEDTEYPQSLKKIKKPPKQLYYRGNYSKNLFRKSLAIVGSRQITRYGAQVVDTFMPDLVAEEVTVISGFMYGVDSEAHKRCIEYGGITVAVFGCSCAILAVIKDPLFSPASTINTPKDASPATILFL